MPRKPLVRIFAPPILLACLVGSAARAQPGGLGNLANPQLGVLEPRADYRALWYPSQPVSGQPTGLGFQRQEVSLSTPLWQDEFNEWSGVASARGEFFQTHAILPNTHMPFPNDLWNIRLGSTYRHQFESEWVAGGGLTVGSASDQPFSTINEMTIGVNAFLRIPQGEHNAWLFSLNYSPTNEIAYPIPGVAYLYAPSADFQATIGFPFASITYHPIEDLTLQLSYALVRTVHAKATYRIHGPFRIFAGFDWDNESYYLADRLDDQLRFFYYEKRVSAGVEYRLGPHVSFDVSGGYGFDRFYFEGKSYSDRNLNRVDVGDGPFAAFQARIRF
jgi:hypothetical protein